MNRNVIVTANEAGQVINVSDKNADYGYIRVEQKKPIFDQNGWARLVNVSALIPGRIEDLKAFGWAAGMSLPGQIVNIESLEAFNSREPEKDYKMAGDTGVVCCLDGQPIYRRSFYTEDEARKDVYIAHNNTDQIKAAQRVTLAKSSEVDELDVDLNQ